MKFLRTLPLAMGLLLSLGSATIRVATAAETFYVGPNNGAWNTGGNWDAGVVPPFQADVVVGEFSPARLGKMNIVFDGNTPHLKTLRINSIGTGAGGTTGGTNFNQTADSTFMSCTTQLLGGGPFDCAYNQSAGKNFGNINVGTPEGSGTYNLSGTAIFSGSQAIGVGGATGVFNQTGGSNTSQITIGYSGNGSKVSAAYNMSGGTLESEVGIGSGLGGTASGSSSFTQSGGTHTSRRLGLHAGDAVYNLTGGTLTMLNGAVALINGGNFFIGAQASFTGALSIGKNGTVHVNGATVSLPGDSAVDGGYRAASSSTQTFGYLAIDSSGYLRGSSGDEFIVGGNLTNSSAAHLQFDLDAARLILSGNGVTHRVAWPGADRGATTLGYQDNFALGILSLTSGGSLALLDGNATAGGAIYVHALLLADGVDQIARIGSSGGMSIFYNVNHPSNAYLHGRTYPLNGGGVLAPASVQPAELGNISTRANIGTGDNVLIGGFIVQGTEPRKLLLRAIGPSLGTQGVPGAISDPSLTLFNETGQQLGMNDNWKSSSQFEELQASGIAPTHDMESALIETVNPGSYTAVVRGVNNVTGLGLVEVYDLGLTAEARLANISSRGFVGTGDNVLVGGFIVLTSSQSVITRAIGPSLAQSGISNGLSDPTIALHDSNGALVAFDNDWKDDAGQASQIVAAGLAPALDRESAVAALLSPGSYTAIVRGAGNTTGVALVEIYNLR